MKIIKSSDNLTLGIMYWWFPIVTLVMITLGLFIFTLPQLKSTASAKDELKTITEKIITTRKRAQQLSTLDPEWLNTQNLTLNEAIPSQKPFFETLSILQTTAQKNNVIIRNFDLQLGVIGTKSAELTAVNGTAKLPVGVIILGTIIDLQNFVAALNNSLPLIEVNSISIGSQVDPKQLIDIVYSAKLSLTANYLLPVPNSALKPNQTVDFNQISEITQKLATFNQASTSPASSSAITNLLRNDLFSY